ncbi:MAG: AAA family ATPase [Microcoleaceae cyanobacterium]
MKLISIRLCNFRQFYGKTPEIFIASGKQNTTVFHGNNGAGKTTLMNAFTWVLYEKFSAAFAVNDQLVNKRALAEAEPGKAVGCWAEVIFEHYYKKYQVKRICRAYKTGNIIEQSPSDFSLQIAAEDGRWMPPPPPQVPEDIINRILPISLHQYFFFDGERIEHIVRDEQKSEIAEATKELLGVEVLNRGIRHLGEARKSLEKDLNMIGNPETKSYLNEKQKLEEEVNQLNQRQTEIEQELIHLTQVKTSYSSHLRDLSGAAEWQKRRDNLEQQSYNLKKQIQQANQTIRETVSSRGYLILMEDNITEFKNKIKELKAKGKLQTGITQQFIQDLLQHQQCICGTEFTADSSHYQHIAAWLQKAGTAEIEESLIWMSGKVDNLEQQVPQFWAEINQQQSNLSQYRQELSRIETELDTLSNKLRHFPDEDIQKLQKNLDETEAKINELNREIGSNQQQIQTLQKSIDKLAKKVDKQQMNQLKQALAQRRIAATQESIDCLIQVKDRLDQQFRFQLEKRVQNIFAKIAFKPYYPKLTENYELKLLENTAGDELKVPASTGENQILSLSFIGGIIEGVREWSQKNTLMGPDSSTFPIVMDSPFGSLDVIYRRQIAQIIPNLANQLIVLVTKTQWRDEVAEELQTRIGREYILTYNSPKPDCHEDEIELGGIRYPLVKRSPNEFEYTEIQEVKYEF